MRRPVSAILAILWLIGTASVSALSAQVLPGDPGSLRSGDILHIQVWRRDDLSGDFVIGMGGKLVHPILKDAVVTNIPYNEVVARIGELLRSFDGTVQFAVSPSLQVVVAGEVRLPGLYYMPPTVSVAEAITRAGGATANGRIGEVELIRDGVRTELDLRDPAEPMGQQPVRSGDQIRVGRRNTILRDVIGPAASMVAALTSVVALIRLVN